MSRTTRALRLLAAAMLAAGCAGPIDSAPPEASPDPSALVVASPASPTTEPSRLNLPAPSVTPTETPVPTPDPTPDPTPKNVFPPRTEVEINADVVERPGVPKALRDNYWWTVRGADVGLLGTTAQLGIPSDEEILDAVDGLVVSSRGTPEKPGGSELVVREFETGATVRTIRTDMGWVNARLVGRRLFWAGLGRGESCLEPAVDGGVWAVDLDGGQPVAIVEPGRELRGCMAGRQIMISPSGETVGGVMSSFHIDDNWIDVIDASSLAHHRLRDVWPDAITDDTLIQWDQPPTDGVSTGSGISAYDLNTGGLRWKFPAAVDAKHFGPGRFLAFGSRFFVQYAWQTNSGTDWVLATFDPLTGERSVLLRQVDTDYDDVVRIQRELSTASHVGLEPFSYSERPRPRSITVINVDSGEVSWDAFRIDPPWLCYPNRCIRD